MDAWALQREGDDWRLSLRGDWSLASLGRIELDLAALPPSSGGALICDWSQAHAPGLGAVWALLERLRALGFTPARIRHEGSAPLSLELLARLKLRADTAPAPAATPGAGAAAAHVRSPAAQRRGLLDQVGRWAVLQGREARGVLEFLGRNTLVFRQALVRPRAFRPTSIVRHVYETGVTAIPIVSLIAFLISVVVAYLGAQQLANFGATIYVVDLVTIAVLRELGVLLTAIIVAGRSGSAFAAEIGVMQINEETDALRAMGMNPIELLVQPRILALMIALPALTVIADAMGLAGGGLLSLVQLHIPLPQFTERLREALAPTTFWAGLIKAPVFAAIIGTVGTYRGMQVRGSARELGRLTTVAVVQSIFLVILADALFAIFFEQIDF
ncbi:MAG TPA: ABC transporter permease [Steroidobacteraceae bacterium]|nr:ABC transporter permease [Steroidobacteraceae bacterium]